MTGADLIVIGGGLHGTSAALQCAQKGLSVILIEKDTAGRHASGVNAGGVRQLGRHVAEIPLSIRSMAMWHHIENIVDDHCGFQPAAQIKVAENEAELATLAARAAELNRLGYDHEVVLSEAELRENLPAVAPHCVGGLASFGDGFAEPYRTVFAFRRKAEAEGVRFFEETRANKVRREGTHFVVETDKGNFTAERVLNCAGAWAGEIAAQLGETAPVEAIAPMMLVAARMPHFCDAVVGATGRPLSFKQMPNGTVVIGGGRRGRADPATNQTHLDFAQLKHTAATAQAIFPIMAGATLVRAWAGIEGRMPDDIPVIGPSSTEEGAYHAFGFSAHGFQLGPGVGSIMAELIVDGRTNAPLEPFSITRFAPPAA
ncbi:NAD(P)/FAD-dependent oxidoreductase [Acuticoccus kandeliae]|uniref:NAD(P)/FAD-dependent oxidoreductase n=1 Tax=Acuticoccus kandeliae TaxID=2073160 RepID=UPI000D3EAEF2|nr:FAD-binding oxidoreductase [Acuticoccus kandeliae]